jgi:hypothetical protein
MRRLLPFVALIAVGIGCSEKPSRSELKNPVGKPQVDDSKPSPNSTVPDPNKKSGE